MMSAGDGMSERPRHIIGQAFQVIIIIYYGVLQYGEALIRADPGRYLMSCFDSN